MGGTVPSQSILNFRAKSFKLFLFYAFLLYLFTIFHLTGSICLPLYKLFKSAELHLSLQLL